MNQENSSDKKDYFEHIRQYVVMGSLALLGGVIGGLLAWSGLNSTKKLQTTGHEVVLEESSAIINVVEKVSPSVVTISTSRDITSFFGENQTVRTGTATGIIISEDGLILTNKHVIPEGTDNITVVTAEGVDYSGQVLARDPLNDIAFIKVEATGLTPAEIGDSDNVQTGQRVIAIGNALGEFTNSVTSGIISGIGRPVTTQNQSEVDQLDDLFQTDAAINLGNSGGPLVNILGQVIGINTAVAGGAENIGFAIPINQVKGGIESVKSTGELIKPYLGVRYVNITKELARERELGVDHGALISASGQAAAIIENSPAEKAGLQEEDIILQINNIEVNQKHGLSSIISRFRAGDSVSLKVYRDGQEINLPATLEELPKNL
ncbi:MAG: trypsin-like peptidase domain-containing protein [Candidatus Saccharimonadales bacterium]